MFIAAISFMCVLGFWFLMGMVLKIQCKKASFPNAFFWATPFLFTLLVLDNPVTLLRTGLFICLMFYIGYFDVKTQTIPRFVHPLILLVGCIGANYGWLVDQAIPGMLVIGLPMYSIYWVLKRTMHYKDAIGLGDIRLMTVCGFYLGLTVGLFGLILGLIFAIVWSISKRLKRDEAFAFGPFLCTGFILALMFSERMVFF
ncbi:prepilin peptidase [Acetobacterium bakii]|uniref:prepilin peptidase n=1 Tax=Acetobacterium bakii TaxID=52689 RepID=UPI0006828D31|nr:prepilin peptidase [Acetobacterium bakii]